MTGTTRQAANLSTAASETPSASGSAHRTLFQVLKLAVFVLATWKFAVPQLPVVWRALRALGDATNFINPGLGAVFAAGALLAYAQVTRSLLNDGVRPGLWHSLGIVLAALGVNRVLPAGNAAGSVVTFRLLGRAGVGGGRAAFAMAAQAFGSAIVLIGLLWGSMAVALPIYGPQPGYVTAAIVGTVLVTLVVALIDGLLHRRSWLWRAVTRIADAVPRFDREGASRVLDDQAVRLRRLTRDRRTMRRAGAWALANWLLDAAALWMFLLAFGVKASPATIILVFAIANVAALLPLTPGGLGIVEITMTAMFTQFGMPLVPTTLGVAAYRVCNYWLPIPLSAISYLAIRRIRSVAPPPPPPPVSATVSATVPS